MISLIPNNWWSFLIAKIVILSFQSVLPLSGVYLVLFSLSHLLEGFKLGFLEQIGKFGWILALWSLMEVFFFFHHSSRVKWMQALSANPYNNDEKERRRVFMRCFRSYHGDPRDFWEGWFLGSKLEDIHLENAREWLLWAIFGLDYKSFDQHPQFESYNVELGEYIQYVEKILRKPFNIGYNSSVKSMRLNLDPVVACHRPLIVYFGIGLFDSHIHWILNRMEFTHYESGKTLGYRPYFPPSYRKASNQKHQLPFSFWHKPARNPSLGLKPIVFIHGIGAGLHSYTLFLKELASSNPDSDIFLVEMIHVSMRFVSKIAQKEEVVDGIEKMLFSYGHSNAIICGHSLGTAVCSWIAKDKPHLVADLLLIDPICLMLHLPHVAYNFVYRVPKRTIELLIWWFASRESGISWALGRSFYWNQNALWKDQIPCMERTTVILAENDAIVPANDVFSYLTSSNLREPEARKEREGLTVVQPKSGPKILWLWEIDHADCIFKYKSEIVKLITEAANSPDPLTFSPETFSKN